jgi:tRNA_anti-like
MKKKIFFAILLIALVTGGYVFYRVTKLRPSLTDATPALSISATDLYDQYQKDETAADKKFADKVIEVTGTIIDVQGTDSTLSIELKGGDLGGINCSIAGGTKANTDQKGGSLTLKGKCNGFLMDVNLTDCVIEDNH